MPSAVQNFLLFISDGLEHDHSLNAIILFSHSPKNPPYFIDLDPEVKSLVCVLATDAVLL